MALRPHRTTRPSGDPPPQQRATTSHHPIERASDTSLRQRLTLAHERIGELDTENRQLRDQLARLHRQLRIARLGNTNVADTVNDTKPQLMPPSERTGAR